jgi:glycine betaine/proline transport system substrate-binding protein
VPIDDVTAINAAMNDGKSVEQAVDDWWASNADRVERWSVMAAE